MEARNLILDNSGQQLLNETKVNSYFEIFHSFIRDFLQWWYVKMPIWHLRTLRRITIVLDDSLSFSILLSNFFLPWHRDPNILGYFVGILSKVVYLPIALAIICTTLITYSIFVIFWLLLPPITIIFIIRSFFL